MAFTSGQVLCPGLVVVLVLVLDLVARYNFDLGPARPARRPRMLLSFRKDRRGRVEPMQDDFDFDAEEPQDGVFVIRLSGDLDSADCCLRGRGGLESAYPPSQRSGWW